ncbi:cytochrome P450 [Streptomyces sp. HNM0574]|uniref:cytochrome P450 family protein n=1 Tax=Streptomyces sp. HNM0574 TaxID=2714954 RepID=UPI00146CF4FC|nr:cytochrome P450 [Streptomyces sp. HNM0574]NLU68905.1 cytochrome P450 [Streptomyces sp. HNM0574]
MTSCPVTGESSAHGTYDSPGRTGPGCPASGDGLVVLDPLVGDLAGEGALLRAAGPVAHVELPGGVRVRAVTRQAEARALLLDSRLVKDIRHWKAWSHGEIPRTWPLIGLADPGPSMLTFDGAEHRRLRTLAAQALTPRRVEALRPRVEAITAELLDALPGTADADGRVDLRAQFAAHLPMRVISELMGIEVADHPRLHRLYGKFFSSVTPADEVQAVIAELFGFFREVVREKQRTPGDDLTSALIEASENGDRLTEDEVLATLQVMIAAGHETTVSLVVSAVRALLTHPDQLALLRAGEVTWDDVIEETLRWDPPTTHVLIRCAAEDIEVGEDTIAQGEAVIISYGAMGRDEVQYGPTAGEFDLTRASKRHLSFGHGPHVCPGAPLSRLEARTALPALFDRYPALSLAVPPEDLRNKPAVTQNDLYALPLHLG